MAWVVEVPLDERRSLAFGGAVGSPWSGDLLLDHRQALEDDLRSGCVHGATR
ncbi:hypothetical protein ACFYYR_14925 [Streptomyces sp. NPDC001922]|uniref:hypothetical protein n=1 Tax=Streptomyces sp. NPDC001922 TaxID=3364624 RepID=UPI003696F109